MTDPLALTDQERVELVARQVNALLHEHQLAGYFLVCAPTHATHGLVLDESAPWLRIAIDARPDGQIRGIRVRSQVKDYMAGGMTESAARALQQQQMEYTISALDFLAMQTAPVAMLTLKALDHLREKFDPVTTGKRVGDAWGKPS